MPVSRKRKKRIAPKKSGHEIVFERLSFGDGGRHAALKEAMLEAVREKVAAFPDLLESLGSVLREHMPDTILAIFAFYGSQAMIAADGSTRSLSKDLLQHHTELLQALILTVPLTEWGLGPPHGGIMQPIFETVPQLADTFAQQRMLERSDETDVQKQVAISLQEKVRLNTQAVRNWGYFSDVIAISRELYAPLDQLLAAGTGFTASDLIDIGQALVTEFETRTSAHMSKMRKVFRAKTTSQLIEAYYEANPEFNDSAADFIASIPAGTAIDGVKGWILSHADLRHFDSMAFSIAAVAALTGKEEAVVQKVLEALSHKPGALVGANVEHLFLANPVWARPGIDLGDRYLFPLPQAIFSHIHEVMRRIVVDAKAETQLAARRAAYLETKVAAVFQATLPTARITRNVKWRLGDQQFETDLVVVVGRTLLLVEAKSHRLTPQALRGAPDRLKRHLGDLVLDPSLQSERLAKLVDAARSGDAASRAITSSAGIDARRIDHVIRLSVTLDDFSILSSSEPDLKEAGWIPKEHDLAPAVHIADLICIADILENEILFLHYLSERFHFQKTYELLGDELDFLGLYLSTGFNLGVPRDDLKTMVIAGLSGPIDRFYDARDAGLTVPKPKPNLHGVYRGLIERLQLRKGEGWTTIGIHLLNSASREEQARMAMGMQRLRKSVLKKSHLPGHECFMQIVPALDRKATIGMYVYRQSMRASRRQNMEQLAADTFAARDADICVIFGKNADRWEEPYETILFAQQPPDTKEGALPATQIEDGSPS